MSITENKNSPRIRRTPEESRANILSAAEDLLVEQGPQSLRLADVAKRAGVANATVLHHFGSIDAVQQALMERMIADLVENILSVEIPADAPLGVRTAGLKTRGHHPAERHAGRRRRPVRPDPRPPDRQTPGTRAGTDATDADGEPGAAVV